ncbi:hypothetical protein [Streptomyces sp. NPDC056323]|uniref:hypothetical protein n=1 Tax=unclassified Streptomyces TaxID=2593676 RepID=UPI0035DBD047
MRRLGKPGRLLAVTTVCDSTGFALQDHLALNVLLEHTEEACIGDRVQLKHLFDDALNPYSFQ